jgi:prophage regulatory protein
MTTSTTPKREPAAPLRLLPTMIEPIIVDRATAAAALSMGESTFRREVAAGRAPAPRLITENRVGWLWSELMAHAHNLPLANLLPPVNTANRKGKRKNPVAANDDSGTARTNFSTRS